MAKRRSFVPECSTSASLEGRVVLSSIGSWFTSQYNHIRQDLGITHRPNHDAAAGIQQLWNNSEALSKPIPAASFHHHHAAKVK